MAAGAIGEADIIIGADARGLGDDVQKQALQNLKNAGQVLGRELANSLSRAAAANSGTVGAALQKGAVSAARQVQAAAATVQKSLGSAAAGAAAQVASIGVAAKNLPGVFGAVSRASAATFSAGAAGAKNFAAGWKSTADGLSSFTGKLGTLGTAARAATGLVTNAFQGIGATAWNGLKAGADATFKAIGSGAKKAAEFVGDSFTTALGGAARGAAAAISVGVAATIGKGFSRLNALNEAEARLTGLGIAGAELTSVMGSADKAVTGTAFSMADAAKAAGLMASAGIAAGEGMDEAMKALVTTTAASGREMAEITPIFTKIAASGKLTGETMAQLLDSGVNVNGALQKQLGKTADEITKMVSSGEIDFSTFAQAINNDLGMLAAAMGGTLSGMTKNVLSAFGRIGAEVQKPIFDGLLVAMPAVLDAAKRLAGAVKEFMAPLQGSLTPLAENFAKVLDGINFDASGLDSFVAALVPLLPLLGAVAGASASLLGTLPVIGPLFAGITGPVGALVGALAALVLVKPDTLVAGFETLGTFLSTQLPGLVLGAVNLISAGLQNLVTNLPVLLAGVTQTIVTLVSSISSALPALIPVLVGAIGQIIPALIGGLLAGLPLIINAAFDLFGGLVTGLLQAVPQLVATFAAAIPGLVKTLTAAIPLILNGALLMFTGIVSAVVQVIPQVISALVSALPLIISALVDAIPLILNAAIGFFGGIISALTTAVPQIITALVGAIPMILGVLVEAIPQVVETGIQVFTGLITALASALPQIITAIVQSIPAILGAIIDAIPLIVQAGIQLFVGLAEAIPQALPAIGKAITGDLLPGIWNAITGKKAETEQVGMGVGTSVATGLTASTFQLASSAGALGATANTTLASYSTPLAATGATLGASANTGLAGSSTAFATTAATLGTTASTSLAANASQMSVAAGVLGSSAATGLAGQTEATRVAANGLASAATIDATQQAEIAKKAGASISAAFGAGITSGKAAIGSAVLGIAAAATNQLAAVGGFVALGRSLSMGVATGISGGSQLVMFALSSLLNTARVMLVNGVINGIGSAFLGLWVSRVSPALAAMVAGTLNAVNRMKLIFASLVPSLQATLYGRIVPVLAALSRAVLTGPPVAFAQATTSILNSWAGIQEAAARPARFVINTVMNGMIGAMNEIPGVSVPKLSAGFARGGVLPGYDAVKRDTILTPMRKGEGVLVPEVVRGLGVSTIHALNRAGNNGGVPAVRAQFGRGLARGGLVNPLPRGSYSVSQGFSGAHNGIDLAAPTGTKVFAAAAGLVQLASSVRLGGNEIYLQHEDLGTRYSHLSEILVRAGQQVRKNQLIGRVGSTGNSTGPHLHYMVHAPSDGGNGNGYRNITDPTGYLGIFGSEADTFAEDLKAKANGYRAAFATTFNAENMFNQAAQGAMNQGLNQIVAFAASKIGTDDSNGSKGSTMRTRLYDNGGILPSGAAGVNLSGRPEAVLTNPQWRTFQAFAEALPMPGERRTTQTTQTTDKRVIIEPGAIVISGAIDPERTSIAVLDRIAEEMGV